MLTDLHYDPLFGTAFATNAWMCGEGMTNSYVNVGVCVCGCVWVMMYRWVWVCAGGGVDVWVCVWMCGGRLTNASHTHTYTL